MSELPPNAAPELALSRLTDLARDAGSRDVPEVWRARVLAAIDVDGAKIPLNHRIDRPERRVRPRALVFALAAASLVVVLVGAFLLRPEAALTYAVTGAPSAESYVRAGPQGARANFSDGTVIGFKPEARGRIVAVTARGARVSVDEGAVHVRVVHRPRAAWAVEAGPFTIAVTGTEFDVSWQHERLDLVMQAGTVTVRGPLASHGISLHGRQHLVADVVRRELTIIDLPPAPGETGALESPPARGASAGETAPAGGLGVSPIVTGSSSPTGTPPAAGLVPPSAPSSFTLALPHPSGHVDGDPQSAAPPGPAGAQAQADQSVDRPAPVAQSLRERVAHGDFASVIAEAEARGVDPMIEESSLADLAALADAARYAGRSGIAQRALLAERSRFPGSAEARSAAFLLGRMTETSSPVAAVGWYDRYLAESPQGALAPEALGRKMVAVKATSGRDAARPIAADYLRRYPGGAFARAAEEIVADR